MSKKCYRFFGGLLNTQEKWLNKMSEKGYRLVRTGKLLYEFEKCKPDEVTYCVEFIGEKSKESSIDYANFLEDMGYKVFFKNINLNYSVGKVRWRPWAERGGQIANPAEPVNGQDERRKCAAVDSPARLCCSVIKRATAQDAAALCHYSERGIFHDRTRKVSRTYPAYTRCLLQDCYSPRCHRRSPEHTEPPQAENLA